MVSQGGADGGNAYAMYELAISYALAAGVQLDPQQSINWLHKAADAGIAPAMTELGVRYQKGDDVQQDWDEAVKWFQKGAAAARRMGSKTSRLLPVRRIFRFFKFVMQMVTVSRAVPTA
jgi:TPR repeat protein